MRQLAQHLGLATKLEIDSAGTGSWHTGSAPDQRAQQTARQHGIDLSGLRARQIRPADFDYYDMIIAMDRDNQTHLMSLAKDYQQHKIHLLLDYSAHYQDDEIPDPYYGGVNGFDLVLDMIEDSCSQLLEILVDR